MDRLQASFAVLLLLGAVASSTAFPFYWASQYAVNNCTKLPAVMEDLASSPHAVPQVNQCVNVLFRGSE
jgi:hypothetical protein